MLNHFYPIPFPSSVFLCQKVELLFSITKKSTKRLKFGEEENPFVVFVCKVKVLISSYITFENNIKKCKGERYVFLNIFVRLCLLFLMFIVSELPTERR